MTRNDYAIANLATVKEWIHVYATHSECKTDNKLCFDAELNEKIEYAQQAVQKIIDYIEDNNTEESLTPALIDEKNATSDWIENIFDNNDCVYHDDEYTGFVNGSVCSCSYVDNIVTWQFPKYFYKHGSYDALVERLNEVGDDSIVTRIDTSTKDRLIIRISFYFKEN